MRSPRLQEMQQYAQPPCCAARAFAGGKQLPHEALEDDGAAGSAGLAGPATARFAQTVAARNRGGLCARLSMCEHKEVVMRGNGMKPRRRRPAQGAGVGNVSAEQASGGDSESASTHWSAGEEVVRADDTPLGQEPAPGRLAHVVVWDPVVMEELIVVPLVHQLPPIV